VRVNGDAPVSRVGEWYVRGAFGKKKTRLRISSSLQGGPARELAWPFFLGAYVGLGLRQSRGIFRKEVAVDTAQPLDKSSAERLPLFNAGGEWARESRRCYT